MRPAKSRVQALAIVDSFNEVFDGAQHFGNSVRDVHITSKGRSVVTRVEGSCSCGSSQVQTWACDERLNIRSKTDALNHTTSYTYDANGNRLTETDATIATKEIEAGFIQLAFG
jgi:YD repeat-containing protein